MWKGVECHVRSGPGRCPIFGHPCGSKSDAEGAAIYLRGIDPCLPMWCISQTPVNRRVLVQGLPPGHQRRVPFSTTITLPQEISAMLIYSILFVVTLNLGLCTRIEITQDVLTPPTHSLINESLSQPDKGLHPLSPVGVYLESDLHPKVQPLDPLQMPLYFCPLPQLSLALFSPRVPAGQGVHQP